MVNIQNLFQARAEFMSEMALLGMKKETASGLFSNLLMNGYCYIANTQNSKAENIKNVFQKLGFKVFIREMHGFMEGHSDIRIAAPDKDWEEVLYG